MSREIEQRINAPKSFWKRMKRRITYSKIMINMIGGFFHLVFRCYYKTLRVSVHYADEQTRDENRQVLFACWDGRQFLTLSYMAHKNVVVMVDLSWVGEILTNILERMGYRIVRGSSRHKSVRSLLKLKKELGQGYSCGIAVDGPRGPKYRTKPGIIFLSNKTSVPIVPLTAGAENGWVLENTWCDYLLPKPFSRCVIKVGAPLATAEGEEGVQAVDKELGELTTACDHVQWNEV